MQTHEPKQGYKLVKSLFGKYEQIPSDWEIRTFEEKFQFLRTGTNSRDELQESGDVNYIHYGDIHAKWNLILDCDKEKLPYIDNEKVNGLPLLKDGDLILVDASEDHEGSGASVLLRNVRDRKIVSGLHTIVLRGIDENVDPNFKTYLTSIKFVKKQIIAYVTGISVYGLSKNNLKKVRIPLPPREEQQKIAAILSRVDDLIQKTEEIIEQTQRLKKDIMKRLFTKGIGHTKFKKIQFHNKRLSIPEKWEVIKLEDNTSKIGSGVTPLGGSQVYQKEGIPFIRSQNVHFDGLHLEEIAYITKDIHDEMSSTKLQPFDVLLNITGASIGRCNYVPPDFGEGNVNQHVCIIRPTEKIHPVFLAKFLSTPLMQGLINSKQGGLSRQGLTFKEISDMSIICPPIEEQKRIADILSSVDTKMNAEYEYKIRLEILKKGLMQKLLTGQIRVKV